MIRRGCILFLSAALPLILAMSRCCGVSALVVVVVVAPYYYSPTSPSVVSASLRMSGLKIHRGMVPIHRSGLPPMNAMNSNNDIDTDNETFLKMSLSSSSSLPSSSSLLAQRINRRSALFTTVKLSSMLGLSSITSRPQAAQASTKNSDLFKPNPLTSPLLEQIRIWNQDEADDIKYGGELASGSDGPPSALDQYATLLQPILGVEYDLSLIDLLLRGGDSAGVADNKELPTQKNATKKEEYLSIFTQIDTVLSSSSSLLSNKLNFKKAFNAFADNIYYSDPDRANLYLAGGAIPKASQSIAYLLRNDILTTVEDMRAEVLYLLKELNSDKSSVDEILGESDIFRMSKVANDGMKKYLDLVPPRELEVAREMFSSVSH